MKLLSDGRERRTAGARRSGVDRALGQRGPAGSLAVAAAAIVPFVGACATEERIVGVRGGLHSLDGAESALTLEARAAGQSGATWEVVLERFHHGEDLREVGDPAPGYPNRRVLADGAHVLVTRSPRDLIVHLYETLAAAEYELMFEQLLAQRTKEAYLDEGLDPVEAGKYLVRNRREVMKLLELMPAAESTPGVFIEPTDRQSYVLRVPNAKAVSAKYDRLEFAIEDGRFVLVMIG